VAHVGQKGAFDPGCFLGFVGSDLEFGGFLAQCLGLARDRLVAAFSPPRFLSDVSTARLLFWHSPTRYGGRAIVRRRLHDEGPFACPL